MKPKTTFLLLTGANLALAVACGWLWSRGRGHRGIQSNRSLVDSQTAAVEEATDSAVTRTNKDGSPFSYLKLFSRDWKRYVANLRSVQCPEETIQDILLAEINRHYAAKEAGLRLRNNQRDPWDPFPVGYRRDWSRYEQLRVLENEKVALVKDLLGIDIQPDLPSLLSTSGTDNFETALSDIPAEKRGAVRDALELFWAKAQQLQDKVNGIYLPADAEEYRKLRQERVAALKKVLSPEEFEKFEQKTSPIANSMANRLSAFGATDDEYRKLFNLQHDYYEDTTLPGQVVGDKGAANQHQMEAQTALDKQIQENLGPGRYAEYVRAQDGAFQGIVRQTDLAGLPRATAVEAYDLSREVRQNWAQIASNNQLPAAEKQQQLLSLQNSAADKFRQLLGDEALKSIPNLYPQYRPPTGPRPPREAPVIRTPINP
ncbi:MAG TPA: hypothetical protein VMF06_13755 [Candidatus Limnocylindria bacterium]|nr:hypothetical protein [Candidatus Limnocylindria bacterium]